MIAVKLLAIVLELLFLALFTPFCLLIYISIEIFYLLFLIIRQTKKQWKKMKI
jgi:hypothetical protein